MAKIKLPVTWESSGFVEVEAETIEEAVNYFNENVDHIQMPYESDYVDGSFDLSDSDPDFISLYNPDIPVGYEEDE